MSQLKIAQLLCSKLTHDLISPVGAIQNGLELLPPFSSDQGDSLEVVQLIENSTRSASAKLTFFRACFGANESFLQSEDVFIKIAQKYLDLKHSQLIWEESKETGLHDLTQWRRLGMMLISVVDDFLPRGGEINVSLTLVNHTLNLSIEASGPLLIIRNESIGILETPHVDITPDISAVTLPSFLGSLLAKEIGCVIKVTQGSEGEKKIKISTHPHDEEEFYSSKLSSVS